MGILTVCLSDTQRTAPCTAVALLFVADTIIRNLCSWFVWANESELGNTLTLTQLFAGMSTWA
jgi:hypothetical protein